MTKIKEETLKNLFQKYKDIFEIEDHDAKNSSVFSEACQYISDVTKDHFNWEELSASSAKNQDLVMLLNVALPKKNSTLEFNKRACLSAIVSTQQQFNDAKQLYLHRDVRYTGIQEKYLKSQLSATEPLTELDMKRFIVATDMVDEIQVVDFNPDMISAAVANHMNPDATEAYSISMLINANSGVDEKNPKWMSLVAKIDPIANKITYSIHAEEHIGEEQKTSIVKALADNVIGANVSGTVKVEKPSGGYTILHKLYQEEFAATENKKATAFAKLASETSTIRDAVYEIELRAITLDSHHLEVLNKEFTDTNFDNGNIKDEAINRQKLMLGHPIPTVTTQHPLVVEKIAELQLYHQRMTFPGEAPEIALGSVDYQQLLLLIQEKFKTSGINKTLDDMVLSGGSTALQGLMAFNEVSGSLPFKKLTLDLQGLKLKDLKPEEVATREQFLFNLKSALLGLSANQLTELQFLDPDSQMDDALVQELADFVKARHLAIDITLPESYRSSNEQRDIDEAVSDHIRERNLAATSKNTVAVSESTVKKDKRTRPKLSGKQSLSIDIELQQEQQVEVAVEATQSNEPGRGGKLQDSGESRVVNVSTFVRALAAGGFHANSKSYLVSSTDESAKKLWCQWLGFFNAEAAGKDGSLRLSKTACEELLRYKDMFQYGLDLANLPPGFILKSEEDPPFIHFDENHKMLAKYNPLQVQTVDIAKPVSLTNGQFKAWLDANQNHPIANTWNILSSKAYDKNNHRVFKQYMPQMLLLDSNALQLLFKICVNQQGTFNAKRFEFLLAHATELKSVVSGNFALTGLDYKLQEVFDNDKDDAVAFLKNYNETAPDYDNHVLKVVVGGDKASEKKIKELISNVSDLNLNGVLQVYIQSGRAGIEQLSQYSSETHLTLFKELNTIIFAKNNSYMPLLKDDFHHAMDAIQGFTPNESMWFKTLLKQHADAQKDVNLVDMVNAFKAFKKELTDLSINEFPEKCNIKDVKSLPVALSRILSLLKHTNEQNRLAQWRELNSLDFSSTGVPKAISDSTYKKWAFITKEMDINAGSAEKTIDKYNVVQNWKEVKQNDPEECVENFFRFVAYQKKGEQLPLELYLYAHDKISKSGLTDDCKAYIYAILASSTTELNNVNAVSSLADAKKEIDALIDQSINVPLPSMTPENVKETARISLLNNLYDLKTAPPLPMLSRLISLISSSLRSWSPLTLIQNIKRLNAANKSLILLVHKYDELVYDGMKNYSDNDYKNKELFFTHIEVLKEIDESIDDIRELYTKMTLMALISTFKLKKEDIKKLIQDHFTNNTPATKDRIKEVLLILSRISIGNKEPLSIDDFNDILNSVKNNSDKEVIDLIKPSDFKAYIPHDYLENYGKQGVPQEVSDLMALNFNDQQQKQIKNMLLRFSGPNDNAEYKAVVNKLITITNPLNKIEKNIFIAKLCGSYGLFTEIKPLDDKKNPFINLLDAMISTGKPDVFTNLVAEERHLVHSSNNKDGFAKSSKGEFSVANLSKRSVFLINDILPKISELAPRNISDLDLMPRLQRVILKAPKAELNQQSTVERDEKTYFDQLNEKFSGAVTALSTKPNEGELFDTSCNNAKRIDFQSLKDATSSFISDSGYQDTETLKTYNENLKQMHPAKVTDETMGELKSNTSLMLLMAYLVNPSSLPLDQKQQFEDRYADNINRMTESHPDLRINKNYIALLLKNPEFFNALANEQTMSALKSQTLLEENDNLELVFTALARDLKGVAEFKSRTKIIKESFDEKAKVMNSFTGIVNYLFTKINKLAGDNPGSKKQFLELFDTYVEHYSPDVDGEFLKYATDFTSTLEQAFSNIEDKNIVLSLCLQFNNDKEEDEELTPENLLELLNTVNAMEKSLQPTFLKIAVALINNDKDYNLEHFKELCAEAQKAPAFAEQLKHIYKKAPFPTIEKVLQWHESVQNNAEYVVDLKRLHTEFDKNPCQREEMNGFDPEKALEQLAKFKVDGRAPSKKDLENAETYFHKFEMLTLSLRGKSTDDLIQIFQRFKGLKDANVDYDLLVAVSAELLHRSKGKDEQDGSHKLGGSFEINTTQYLALLTMMKQPGHTTSQIGTGEGKSRIMMIALACQNALGKTSDFVTSDAQLATRDFVEYQAYFELIGAKTSMIFAGSDPSEYVKGGINFSDPSNLELFRNKAESIGRGDEVLDANKNNRALLLDEADKTFFDVADTRFNFSKEGDESIRGMEWVYPLLMEYFAQEQVIIDSGATISPLDLYYDDIDKSREKFLQFATSNCNEAQLMRLKALSNAQIEQWQVSAVTASQLKIKEDFVIEPDVLISTPQGPKISSEAQLLFGNRISKSSKFSFGVHQCLHARLNIARAHIDSVDDPVLAKALLDCEQAFYVAEEKQIVYSTTSKNLVDNYQEGTVKTVTGTAGPEQERKEARKLYGKKDADGVMHFIDNPRDKEMKRKDRAIRLTANSKQQFDTLVEQIKEARRKNQPIVIVEENDQASAALFEKLNKVFKNDIQHVHSQLSSEKEKELVDKAGKPRQITVTTDMIGRGTDIKLQKGADKHGLNVMVLYLPRVRDLEQIIGRSGRFGANGETSVILDKQRLKKAIGKKALGSDYYRNVEVYIQREQAIMDRNKQCERIIKNTIGDFRKELTQNFFIDTLRNVQKDERKKCMPAWTAFFDKSDKAWNEIWPKIQAELAKDDIEIGAINKLLETYREQVQKHWDSLRRTINDVDVVCNDGKKPIETLREKVSALKLSKSNAAIINDFDIEQYAFDTAKVYDRYDPGHDGRAVTYSHWYIPLIATLKGYANLLPLVHFDDARKPFANFRAWWEGRGVIFPNTRAFFADMVDAIANYILFGPEPEPSSTPATTTSQTSETSYSKFFKMGIAKKEQSNLDNLHEESQLKQETQEKIEEKKTIETEPTPTAEVTGINEDISKGP